MMIRPFRGPNSSTIQSKYVKVETLTDRISNLEMSSKRTTVISKQPLKKESKFPLSSTGGGVSVSGSEEKEKQLDSSNTNVVE
jgi:hypothetical protein